MHSAPRGGHDFAERTFQDPQLLTAAPPSQILHADSVAGLVVGFDEGQVIRVRTIFDPDRTCPHSGFRPRNHHAHT